MENLKLRKTHSFSHFSHREDLPRLTRHTMSQCILKNFEQKIAQKKSRMPSCACSNNEGILSNKQAQVDIIPKFINEENLSPIRKRKERNTKNISIFDDMYDKKFEDVKPEEIHSKPFNFDLYFDSDSNNKINLEHLIFEHKSQDLQPAMDFLVNNNDKQKREIPNRNSVEGSHGQKDPNDNKSKQECIEKKSIKEEQQSMIIKPIMDVPIITFEFDENGFIFEEQRKKERKSNAVECHKSVSNLQNMHKDKEKDNITSLYQSSAYEKRDASSGSVSIGSYHNDNVLIAKKNKFEKKAESLIMGACKEQAHSEKSDVKVKSFKKKSSDEYDGDQSDKRHNNESDEHGEKYLSLKNHDIAIDIHDEITVKHAIEIKTIHEKDKYKLLTDLPSLEANFSSSVNDFSKYFKESNELLLRRRTAFLKDEFFLGHIVKDNCNEDLNKLKLQSFDYPSILSVSFAHFESTHGFSSLFKIISKEEANQVLTNLRKSNSSTLLISDIRDINFFKARYAFKSREVLDSCEKEFSYWRSISCDGDSFYRGFMFALLENYLITKNISQLKQIIWDFTRVYNREDSIFISRQIDFKKVLTVLSLLFENIKSNNLLVSYEILHNAYKSEDKNFDIALIGYMRYIIWINLMQLENKDHVTANDMPSHQRVLSFQNEPDKLIMSVIPYIFKVTLEICAVDGSVSRSNDTLKYQHLRFTDHSNNERPIITLGYFFSSYHRLYSLEFFEGKVKPIIDSKEIDREKEASFQFGDEDAVCTKCNKLSKFLYFEIFLTKTCFECLKKHILKIIENRAHHFYKENFINRECIYLCNSL